MTHPNSQSDRPALRSAIFVVSDRLRLLARYAWTRPLVYRVVGVLAVVYTIMAAVYDEAALWAWLSGLAVGVVGWGVTLEASRLSASDLQRFARTSEWDSPGTWLELLLKRLPLPVARRIELLIAAILIVMAAILIFASLARTVRSAFAL
jgi:hypothetical protein